LIVRRHVSVSENTHPDIGFVQNFIFSVHRATELALICILLQHSKANVLACAEVVLVVVYREPLWVQGKPKVGGPVRCISSEHLAVRGTFAMSSLPLL